MSQNTNANYLSQTANQLVGAAVIAANLVEYVGSSQRNLAVAAGAGLSIGSYSFDEVLAAYTSNAGILLTLTGSTAITIDVTNISATATSSAGQNTFASKVNTMILQNIGAQALTIAQGTSNPLSLGLAGTTPTLSIAAGSTHVLNLGTPSAGSPVSGTTKTFTVTPTSGGSLLIYLGGA